MRSAAIIAMIVALSMSVANETYARGGGGYRKGGGGRSSGRSGGSHVRVKSYTTKKGTHIGSHKRTNADKSKANNWSTKGNVNPYTGKEGTKNP